MSRATTEQALTGLIPTLSGPLPSELVDLTISLLARSRSVAQSLKPDEEIARPYACAQLACERLKQRLNLPSISPRPPCPPRIYKKLYSYLESALPAPATARAPQTPRKGERSAPASARTTPKSALSTKQTPKSARRDGNRDLNPPEWVVPTIRTLLKAFDYPNAAGHVYTGIEVILPLLARMSAAAAAETPTKRTRRANPAQQPSTSDPPESRVLGLIAVVLFYVLSRMLDQDNTPDQFLQWREKAITTLLETPIGANTSETEIGAEIDMLMPMAQEEGWIRMDWFLNVLPPSIDEMEGVESAGVASVTPVNPARNVREDGSNHIGLGTMMQDATDYLSERRREDYKMWKASIVARIEATELSS